MGVPSFYRWLHEKFSKCITEYVEPAVPLDTDWSAAPNPNGVEFDCVYLDFNGLVHACTHPQDRPAPESEEEMLLEVFRLVDRLVLAARVLLPLDALDLDAERAKLRRELIVHIVRNVVVVLRHARRRELAVVRAQVDGRTFHHLLGQLDLIAQPHTSDRFGLHALTSTLERCAIL